MGQQDTTQRQSWLSLVAETAGVSGATVLRIEIRGESVLGRAEDEWVRAIVQIQDAFGGVVGAVGWEGQARELAQGVNVDIGCDLAAAWGSRVVGWIPITNESVEPARAVAPLNATARAFEPSRAMKLMLHRPVRRAISARSFSPRVAA